MIHQDIHEQATLHFGETKGGVICYFLISVGSFFVSNIDIVDKWIGLVIKLATCVLLTYTIRNAYYIHKKNKAEQDAKKNG